MKQVKVNASRESILEFKKSILWNDIVKELRGWKKGFNIEMLGIVDDAAKENPSTASVLLHMGDLNGRQRAVDYFLSILDVFLSILEEDKENKESEVS